MPAPEPRRQRRRLVPAGAAAFAMAAVVAAAVAVAGPVPGAHGTATGRGASGSVPTGAVGTAPTAAAGAGGAARQAAARTGQAPASGATAPGHVPTGFAGQVDAVYRGLVRTVTALDARDPAQLASAGQLPSASQFEADVAGLQPAELAVLYRAARLDGRWSSVVADVGRMAASATTSPSGSAAGLTSPVRSTSPTGSTSAAGSSHALTAHVSPGPGVPASTFPPAEPTGSFPAPPAPYQPTAPVGPYSPTSCPAGAPGGPSIAPGDSAIFAAQLTNDVAANVAQDVPDTITVIIAGEGTSIPDPAKYIAEAVQLAAVITLDTFNYVQAVASDCDTANRDGYLANIDNTTVNVYDLLTMVEGTLDHVESSINTISQRLGVLQQTLDAQLTLAIEQALSAPLSSMPNLAFELPASVGGNLDSTPIGVQQVVHAAVRARLAAGAPVNAAARQFLAMGDAALASGEYKVAFADYHQAYLQAVGQ